MKDTLLICSYREFLNNYLSKKFPRARKEDIEDVVQNTIIKALRHSNGYKGDCTLKTWLAVIAKNMYTDSFRKTYVKNEYILNSSEELFVFDKIPVDDFSETLCDIDYQNKLFKELLTGFEDNIFIKTLSMHIIDDIDYKNIAIQLDIPLGTVKGRIFRAKKLLQEKYREISSKYEETTV
jgi:RNA polymerase sigma-70 factor (ECF subfamily)